MRHASGHALLRLMATRLYWHAAAVRLADNTHSLHIVSMHEALPLCMKTDDTTTVSDLKVVVLQMCILHDVQLFML